MMDIEEFRRAGYQAIDRICDYYTSLAEKPVVAQVKPGFLIKALPHEAPEKGESIDRIAQDFQDLILPGITHWQHPSFFAYYSSNATFPGMLADLYASSVSNPGFNWLCSPACTELESVVMDWSAKLLGLDHCFHVESGQGGGAIQVSASDSALVATIIARGRFTAAHPSIPAEDLIIYISTQTHSLGAKTARLLNLNYRELDVKGSDDYSLTGETLLKAYEEDRSRGKWPFVLIATVGTTSSGAVDRLEEIGPIVETFPDFWLHVDAAWAGVTLACPEYRESGKLEYINKHAQSLCVNFHKMGLVNFDASALWVRDRRELTDALDVTPAFLRTKQGDDGSVIDYRNWSIGLGRRFRSLKFWFVLRSYGVEGFRAHIRKAVRLAGTFADLVRSSSIFVIAAPPSLSLVVFRLGPPEVPPSEVETVNALNLELHRRLTEGPDLLFLTRTELNKKVSLRLAIGAERTQDIHIQEAYRILEKVGKDVLDSFGYVSR